MLQYQARPRIGALVGLAAAVATGFLWTGEDRPALAYIDNPPGSLGEVCAAADTIAVLRVERVKREKKAIVYRKERDLKGSFPAPNRYFGDTLTHVLRASPNPDWHREDGANRDWQNEAILDWAAEGKIAVIFQRGGEQAVCTGHRWYTTRGNPPANEHWVLGAGCDSRFGWFYCGEPEGLVSAISDLLAGKEIVVPRMVGTVKMLSDWLAPIRRFPAHKADRQREFFDPFFGQTPWSSHRGNPQRTGTDDEAGPQSPKLLWVHDSDDRFIAPLLPGARDLYASSLGAFNLPRLQALCLEPAGKKQLLWVKGAPLVRKAIAAAPALFHGQAEMLIIGDGVPGDEGASLRGVRASDGLLLWELPIPGKRVHFAGTPTIADAKLYVGGGNAGVLCIDLSQPVPRRVWQQGQDRWHVDAPVAVVAERVLAASAYLDDHKTGERALVCLKASDGSLLWKAPLKLNPWAGPTVGPYVLVGCSDTGPDSNTVSGAKGEVVAFELDTGKIKWRMDVPGGIVSSVAVKAGLAIFTATDGKVRALDAFTGQEKWTYDARAPFCAGPAVTRKTVYAADLKGGVHALGLAEGKNKWTMNLPTNPATRTRGMVCGSPIVHRSRLYLATCSLAGRDAPTRNVVVCIGDR
jgi:outer membrane protein assembly factor BamB